MTSKAKTQVLKTHADLAIATGVSTKTVGAWTDYADWPGREAGGAFSLAKVTAFCKRNRLGPFNRSRTSGSGREAMNEARIAYLRERTERERIGKERDLAAQQIQLGNIVLMSDVATLHGRLASVVCTELDSIPDAVDIALPRDMADEARQRVMEVLNRAVAGVRRAAQEFLRGGSNDDQE